MPPVPITHTFHLCAWAGWAPYPLQAFQADLSFSLWTVGEMAEGFQPPLTVEGLGTTAQEGASDKERAWDFVPAGSGRPLPHQGSSTQQFQPRSSVGPHSSASPRTAHYYPNPHPPAASSKGTGSEVPSPCEGVGKTRKERLRHCRPVDVRQGCEIGPGTPSLVQDPSHWQAAEKVGRGQGTCSGSSLGDHFSGRPYLLFWGGARPSQVPPP